MLLRKKNSTAPVLLCLMLACCQKIDLTTTPDGTDNVNSSALATAIVGTGKGTTECPYTVTDIRSLSLPSNEAIWVIGYMVGTARTSMSHAVFSIDAENQSNILLSFDSLCTDTAHCIPIELTTDKWRERFSLPANVIHFRKCLLVKGIPSQYLHRKGLRKVSAGLWLDGFDISSVEPTEWGTITF